MNVKQKQNTNKVLQKQTLTVHFYLVSKSKQIKNNIQISVAPGPGCLACLLADTGGFIAENPFSRLQVGYGLFRARLSGLEQHFQDLGHSFSLYGPPSPTTYIYTKQSSKNICIEEKVIILLTFNLGLMLTCLRTILP